MFYQKFSPTPHLAPFVECYYVWESHQFISPARPIVVESPPSGYGSLVVNLGERYAVETPKQGAIAVPAMFLSGQATRQYQLYLTGPVRVVAAVFRPAGLGSLFSLPMIEFADERIDLTAVLGQQTTLLAEQLAETLSPTARVGMLEGFLLRQLLKHNLVPDRLDHTANLIVARRGIVSVDELANTAFLCRRQFDRKFLQRVGVSPKFYTRIRRTGYLCSLLANQRWNIAD
ncbi:MAG: AraC family transcriptional regulator, partial [Rudanella sp.]|nr:AraC family transcriptional regulator [Rudanella sp.]